jgi:hypothetical protein
MSDAGLCFTLPVLGSAASFIVWKEALETHWECAFPNSSNLRRLQGQGAEDPLPNGVWWSVSRWGLQNVAGKSPDQREQDSNLGRWRKGSLLR